MEPSASDALAVNVMLAGAVKLLLLAGAVIDTVGGVFPGVLPLANTWLIVFTSFDLVLGQKISLPLATGAARHIRAYRHIPAIG